MAALERLGESVASPLVGFLPHPPQSLRRPTTFCSCSQPSDGVTASRDRLCRQQYRRAPDAELAASVSGVTVKNVGRDVDSYRALLAEIERPNRDCPIVLASPTMDGHYLINSKELQERLVGLGQVVQVCRDFNSYEMAEVIGQHRSAWSGAVNVIYTSSQTGKVRNRHFRADEILVWGDKQNERISQLLAWVTNNTNVLRLRKRVRPEGVTQLALRRRLQALHAERADMDAARLREEIGKFSRLVEDQTTWISIVQDENTELETKLAEANVTLEEERKRLNKQNYVIQTLKDRLEKAWIGLKISGSHYSGQPL